MKKKILTIVFGLFLFAGAFGVTYSVSADGGCDGNCDQTGQGGKRYCGCACQSNNCAATTRCFYCGADEND